MTLPTNKHFTKQRIKNAAKVIERELEQPDRKWSFVNSKTRVLKEPNKQASIVSNTVYKDTYSAVLLDNKNKISLKQN